MREKLKLRKNNEALRGFSMMEIMSVLIIISVMMAGITFSYRVRLDAAKIYTTKQNMSIIISALERYVELYGHLPCPANINLANTHTNYGHATGSNSLTSSDICSQSVKWGSTASYTQNDFIENDTSGNDNDIVVGMIPFNSFNPPLPANIAIDGWGSRFVYVLPKQYATTTGFQNTSDTFGSSIEVYADSGSTFNIADSQLAYILLSHGPNKHNAIIDKTTTQFTATNTTTADAKNSDNDANFVQDFVSSDNDDILYFQTKWQMPDYIYSGL